MMVARESGWGILRHPYLNFLYSDDKIGAFLLSRDWLLGTSPGFRSRGRFLLE